MRSRHRSSISVRPGSEESGRARPMGSRRQGEGLPATRRPETDRRATRRVVGRPTARGSPSTTNRTGCPAGLVVATRHRVRRPHRWGQEDSSAPDVCVRARTRETKTTARRRPRKVGAGDSPREVKGGRGKAPRPHHAATPRGEAAPSQGHRSPADDLPSVLRVARPPDVLVFVPEVRPGHPPPGLPDAACPIPGLRGRRVAATPLQARRPSGVLRWHHRGRLRHIRAPHGATPASPLELTCGLRSPDVSSPTSTRADGLVGVVDQRSALLLVARGCPRCPRTIGTAPVSSILLLHQHRDRVARMVEHPTGVVTSTHERPSLRGVVRTRPDRGPDGASPAGDRGWEAEPGTASSPTRPGCSLARPTAMNLAVHSHRAEPLPPRSRCHTSRETCPGGQPEVRVAPGHRKKACVDRLQPQRRAPPPRTVDDQGRGWFAWLVLPGSGRRRGRYSLGGRRHGACHRRRSRVPPCPLRGAGWGPKPAVARRSVARFPGFRRLPISLAAKGVRTVPRAED